MRSLSQKLSQTISVVTAQTQNTPDCWRSGHLNGAGSLYHNFPYFLTHGLTYAHTFFSLVSGIFVICIRNDPPFLYPCGRPHENHMIGVGRCVPYWASWAVVFWPARQVQHSGRLGFFSSDLGYPRRLWCHVLFLISSQRLLCLDSCLDRGRWWTGPIVVHGSNHLVAVWRRRMSVVRAFCGWQSDRA